MNFFTSTSLAMAIVGAGLVAVQGAWAEDRFSSGLAPSKIVTGEVAQVEGEFHMAKGPEGVARVVMPLSSLAPSTYTVRVEVTAGDDHGAQVVAFTVSQ